MARSASRARQRSRTAPPFPASVRVCTSTRRVLTAFCARSRQGPALSSLRSASNGFVSRERAIEFGEEGAGPAQGVGRGRHASTRTEPSIALWIPATRCAPATSSGSPRPASGRSTPSSALVGRIVDKLACSPTFEGRPDRVQVEAALERITHRIMVQRDWDDNRVELTTAAG